MPAMDPRPVGVFDSGVGGLTVLHECLVTMPNEDFVYLGDHARLPYGPRPLGEVARFAHEIARYHTLVHTLDAGARLTAVACPELVPLIEAGEQTTEAVRRYAQPLKVAGCDTVILGCTHYPLIRPVLERAFGRDVSLVFSADETAREVDETLRRKGMVNAAD